MRFGWKYIMTIAISPMISFFPLFFLYGGFFFYFNKDLITVNRYNYGAWILMGIIFFQFCNRMLIRYENVFVREKYWHTIEFTLLAPINRYSVLFGFVIQNILEQTAISIILAIVAFLYSPTLIPNIFLIFIVLAFFSSGVAGLGILRGVIALSNENFMSLFGLLSFVFLFLSSYSIPIELFPLPIAMVIRINPLYMELALIRNIWFYPLTWFSDIFVNSLTLNFFGINFFDIIYIVCFNLIAIVLGMYFFDRIWERFGIHGF